MQRQDFLGRCMRNLGFQNYNLLHKQKRLLAHGTPCSTPTHPLGLKDPLKDRYAGGEYIHSHSALVVANLCLYNCQGRHPTL